MLVGPDVLLQEGVEVEENETVHADHPRHCPHHGQASLKALVAALLQPRQQLLGKILQRATWAAGQRVHDAGCRGKCLLNRLTGLLDLAAAGFKTCQTAWRKRQA